MNRAKLERHLRENGCHFSHHGGKHDIWMNPATGQDAPMPRHTDIKEMDCARSVQEPWYRSTIGSLSTFKEMHSFHSAAANGSHRAVLRGSSLSLVALTLLTLSACRTVQRSNPKTVAPGVTFYETPKRLTGKLIFLVYPHEFLSEAPQKNLASIHEIDLQNQKVQKVTVAASGQFVPSSSGESFTVVSVAIIQTDRISKSAISGLLPA